MVGAIVSAGLGAIGSIYGAVKAGQERKKLEAYTNQQAAENEAKYNRDYNGDYLQRADSQAVMKQMRDTLKDRTQQTNSTAAITGATPEAQLAAMEANNQVVGDTMSKLGAMGAAFKDKVDDRYMARKDYIMQQRQAMTEGAARSGEALLSNGISVAGNALGSLATAKLVPELGIKKNGIPGAEIAGQSTGLPDFTAKWKNTFKQ